MPRILVVEDDVVVGIYLREELQDAGYETVVFDEAESVLSSLDLDSVDAAIIDVSLPGMSGIELVKHIRAIQPDFRVLLSTGRETGEIEARWTIDQHACILPKPYQTTALMERLKRLGL